MSSDFPPYVLSHEAATLARYRHYHGISNCCGRRVLGDPHRGKAGGGDHYCADPGDSEHAPGGDNARASSTPCQPAVKSPYGPAAYKDSARTTAQPPTGTSIIGRAAFRASSSSSAATRS